MVKLIYSVNYLFDCYDTTPDKILNLVYFGFLKPINISGTIFFDSKNVNQFLKRKIK